MGKVVNIDEWDAEEFLEVVYGSRRGWVDLPSKVGGHWVPWYHRWEGEADDAITRRIDSCLADGESLYFSVAQFSQRGRLNDMARGGSWLWADLDEVAPQEAGRDGLLPTIAWESSPGRYQALWRLEQRVSPETLEKLNRALSYHLGADSSGWDLAQVLRLPGTRNYKYRGAPPVKLMWYDEGLVYDARDVWKRVKHHHQELSGGGSSLLPRKALPARAAALLRVPAESVVEGERSSRMWEIECLLAESGWGEDEIVGVVGDCAWNKWAHVRTGETRLRREVRKALAHVRRRRLLDVQDDVGEEDDGGMGDDEGAGRSETADDAHSERGVLATKEDDEGLPFVRYASFMAMQIAEPRWLIEGIWSGESHGIIGGEPKTSKTTLALAMCLSVASGKPFLGQYPVHTQGPVLMVQEENPPWQIQDRLRKIAASYGLIRPSKEIKASKASLFKKTVELDFPDDVPFRVLNNYGFNLTQEEHRDALEAEIEAVRPVMLVLDPMYLIFGGADYDKARELYPYLSYLMHLRYEYNCAVVLIHHYKKHVGGTNGGPRVGGQRLMGSATLHGWIDSAFYTERMGEDGSSDLRVKLTREFRNVAPQNPIEICMNMGEPGTLDFNAEIKGFDMGTLIRRIVEEEPGITANLVAERLGCDKRTVLVRARGEGSLHVVSGKRGRGHSHRLYLEGAVNGNGGGE